MRAEPTRQLPDRHLRVHTPGPTDLLEQLHPQPLASGPTLNQKIGPNQTSTRRSSGAKTGEHTQESEADGKKWYDEMVNPNLPPGVGIIQDRRYYPLHTAFTK